MKTLDFTQYAGRLAYAYAYDYATLLFESDIAPDYYFERNEAIRFIREFAVNMELDHGIELSITDDVMIAIDTYFELGWKDYLERVPSLKRIKGINDLQPHTSSRHYIERVTRSAYRIHQGEANVLIVLPMASCVLDFKLACLDIAYEIIKESK